MMTLLQALIFKRDHPGHTDDIVLSDPEMFSTVNEYMAEVDYQTIGEMVWNVLTLHAMTPDETACLTDVLHEVRYGGDERTPEMIAAMRVDARFLRTPDMEHDDLANAVDERADSFEAGMYRDDWM
jgi:hypothetical protein